MQGVAGPAGDGHGRSETGAGYDADAWQGRERAMNEDDAADQATPPLSALLPGSALEGLLRAALESSGRAVALKDGASGRYLLVDASMASLFGCAPAEMIGRNDAELFPPAVAGVLHAADQTALARRGLLASEHVFEWRGAHREFSAWRLAAASPRDGARVLCVSWCDEAPARLQTQRLDRALRQIEEQQRAYEALVRELADHALRDPASGVHGRSHFEEQLRREVDLSTREHREFALVFIEVDAGMAAALPPGARERIVAALGWLLRHGTRAMDTSGRLGEGHFAVLLSGAGLATAYARMEDLRRRCAAHIVVHEGREIGFTVSVGVAAFPLTAVTQDALQAACAAALAESLRAGGDRVSLARIRLGGG